MYARAIRVHNDDIHGISVTAGTERLSKKIISGSKDSSIKKFNLEGELEVELARHPGATDDHHSYKNWVTGLDVFPDGSFVAGHRNSYLLCRDSAGRRTFFSRKVSDLTSSEAVRSSAVGTSLSAGAGAGGAGGAGSAPRFYKQRNETRVTGVKCLFDELKGYRALVGIPEMFMEINCTTKDVVKTYRFDKPEWIYGFEKISPVLMVAIHGCYLSLFKDQEDHWDKVKTLVKEDRSMRPFPVEGPSSTDIAVEGNSSFEEVRKSTKKAQGFRAGAGASRFSAPSLPSTPIQRPYISSVMNGLSPGHLALSFFGGANQILDIEHDALIHRGIEHRERVWQTVPFTPTEYATCADDKTVKIWDIRAGSASVMTYADHPGRVSALAFFGEKQFVAGTCPENPWEDEEKGQFWFYDLRGGK